MKTRPSGHRQTETEDVANLWANHTLAACLDHMPLAQLPNHGPTVKNNEIQRNLGLCTFNLPD